MSAGIIQVVVLTALTIAGAVLSAIIGYLGSEDVFETQKFVSSMLTAVIAGALLAYGFSMLQVIEVWDYLLAFLSGAGADVLRHRIVRAATK